MRDFLHGLHNDFPFFSTIVKAEKIEKLKNLPICMTKMLYYIHEISKTLKHAL